jgi:hypothetical protein
MIHNPKIVYTKPPHGDLLDPTGTSTGHAAATQIAGRREISAGLTAGLEHARVLVARSGDGEVVRDPLRRGLQCDSPYR